MLRAGLPCPAEGAALTRAGRPISVRAPCCLGRGQEAIFCRGVRCTLQLLHHVRGQDWSAV
eukprot:8514412-Lingulodinium_polyedra.AAC.1